MKKLLLKPHATVNINKNCIASGFNLFVSTSISYVQEFNHFLPRSSNHNIVQYFF